MERLGRLGKKRTMDYALTFLTNWALKNRSDFRRELRKRIHDEKKDVENNPSLPRETLEELVRETEQEYKPDPRGKNKRLATLTEEGLLDKCRYSEHPPREEYLLSAAGRDFFASAVPNRGLGT